LKKILTWVSGPLLALLFLWYTYRGIELAVLLRSVRSASLPLLGLLFASSIAHLCLRSWRWGTLLDPVCPRAELAYRERLSATAIGNMALVLPGRVGEVLRPAVLSRRIGIPFGTTLATVGVERVVLDLLVILTFGALALLLPSRWSGIGTAANAETLAVVRSSGLLLFAGALGGLAVAAIVARRRAAVEALLERLAATARKRPLVAALRWLTTLLPGLAAFSTARGILKLGLESLIIWSVIAAGIHAGIVACGVELAPLATLILVPVLAAGIAVPTPAGTGSYHAAMYAGVHLILGGPETGAQTAGLLVHGVTVFSMIALGGLFVAIGGLGSLPGVER
jgi:hypothetical protein